MSYKTPVEKCIACRGTAADKTIDWKHIPIPSFGNPDNSAVKVATIGLNPATNEPQLPKLTDYRKQFRQDLTVRTQAYLEPFEGEGFERFGSNRWKTVQVSRLEFSRRKINAFGKDRFSDLAAQLITIAVTCRLASQLIAVQFVAMGIARAKIKLENPKRSDIKVVEADALVDTGSLFLCLPEEVRLQLQLQETSKKEVTTADGKRCLCPYVGPVRVQFGNRECYVGAVILGDEVLLGAVPMEDMDLVVIASARKVVPNPLHPDFAAGPAK